MAFDVVERVARVMALSCYRAQPEDRRAAIADKAWRVFAQEAEAAVREVLADLRGWEWAERADQEFLDAYAQSRGLEPRQGPQEGRSGDGATSGASDAENAPDGSYGALPAHRTPGGHAA
jgi:hypothetical protein